MAEEEKTQSTETNEAQQQQNAAEEEASQQEQKEASDIQEVTTLHERTIAVLSYAGFFAIVPFYLKKESKFCRFHGKQGMMVAFIFFFAKLLLVLDILMDLALILQFVIFVYMGFAALSGRWKKMPLIYKWSLELEKQLALKTKEESEEDEKFPPNVTPSTDAEAETATATSDNSQ